MSGGEIYFWGVVSLIGFLLVAASIAAFRDSLRPPGGARFISEEEFGRIERQGRR